MSRRNRAPKRTVLPDPKFGNEQLTKFVNVIMKDGKKSVAEKIVYGALDVVEAKGNNEPLETLFSALDNIGQIGRASCRERV